MDEGLRLEDINEAVVFVLAGQRYALPIQAVQEIQQIVAMNDVPDSTPGVVGMVNLRGMVIPAVDVRRLLRMESRGYELQTPMIITRLSGGLVALIVDEVEDVVSLPRHSLQAPDGVYEMAERLLAVCRLENELVFLLDPDRLITRRGTRAPASAAVPAAPADPTLFALEADEAPAKPKRTRKKAT